MAPRACLLTIALVWLGPATSDAQDRERKRAAAVRVAEGAVRVDGRLDEAVWRQATPLAGFTQKEPVEGAPATDDLDVRFVYDNGALYVGARMTSSAPIQAPLGRRDDVEQAEHLLVSLDTYLDRRTASTFGVTRQRRAPGPLLRQRQRLRRRRHLQPGLAGADVGGRAGVDGGAADPVLAAALQRALAADLGPQRAPLDPVAQRGGVLVARSGAPTNAGRRCSAICTASTCSRGSASSCCRMSPATRG